MKKKRFISVILTFAMVLGMCVGLVYGDPQSDLASIKEDKAKVDDEMSDAEIELNKQIKELEEIQSKIDKKEAERKTAEKKYESTKQEIKDLETEIENKRGQVGERLRAMYKSGSVGFMDVILESCDMSELLSNIVFVQRIYENDENVLETMESDMNSLRKKEAELTTLKSEIEGAKAAIEKEKLEAESKKAEMEGNVSELKAEYDRLTAKEQAASAAIAEELRKRQEEEAAKNKVPSGGNTPSNGGNVTPPSGGGDVPSGGGNVPSAGGFLWPCNSHIITSPFGWRTHPIFGTQRLHTGTDIGAPTGTPVYASKAGTIVMACYYPGYGNFVLIDHGGGIATGYAHLNSYCVSAGQTVSQGQVVGAVGSTGNSTGPHLHFEVRINGTPVNPMQFF